MAADGQLSLEAAGATENGLEDEELDQDEIERDLDTLTLTGSTINDLELKLTRSKVIYRRTLEDCQAQLQATRRRLQSHIVKSEPFVDVWRRARQIQEASNRAAARFDKANSQYAAAREMIRVAEEKLSTVSEEVPVSPSLDLAWQEMLNHATARVVETERERRDSEMEHKRILEECQVVMEEYKNTERRLRSHITKSRPFYEQRYEFNRKLQRIKQFIVNLEAQVRLSKNTYTQTLKKLEDMNARIHERRRSISIQVLKEQHANRQRSSSDLNLRVRGRSLEVGPHSGKRSSSANTSPETRRKLTNGVSDTDSLESLQLGDAQFTGSTGSLPSIGTSSVSDSCPTPDVREEKQEPVVQVETRAPSSQAAPEIRVQSPEEEVCVAHDLVSQVLERAAAKLEEEMRKQS